MRNLLCTMIMSVVYYDTNRMQLKFPRKYLSYSSLSLWQKDKGAFRRKYYENIDLLVTREMLFGKEIAERLEAGDSALARIPRYKKAEAEITVEVDGIPIMGYIDSFSPSHRAFIEYKTGYREWNQHMVEKHDQLPFYSFLIEQKFGRVAPRCRLIWLETRFKPSFVEFDGHQLAGDSGELELTGRVETFYRTIEPWEHERIHAMIVRCAQEIHNDYTQWLQTQS